LIYVHTLHSMSFRLVYRKADIHICAIV